MMKYTEICNHNKFLFTQLEGLTNQISYCIANQIEVDLEQLMQQKDAIKSVIDDNLEKIEVIWRIEALKANTSVTDILTPSGKEKRVIGLYLQSENNTVAAISKASGENEIAVGRIISRFLANGYNLAG